MTELTNEIKTNTTILELLKHLYVSATQDEAGCRNGCKGYRMRYDELPELVEKEIGKIANNLIHQAEITAVKKELKKLLPPHQLEWYQETSGGFCSICGFSAREYKNYINDRIKALEKEIV